MESDLWQQVKDIGPDAAMLCNFIEELLDRILAESSTDYRRGGDS